MESERRVQAGHLSVMADEVVRLLRPQPGAVVVDCTLGSGGHAARIAEGLGKRGVLIGIDRDKEALDRARRRLRTFPGTLRIVHGDFADAAEILEGIGIGGVDGVLLDLGVSTEQLLDPDRGFGIRAGGRLDMRMDRSGGVTAENLVNSLPEEELCRILREYGEERMAARIAGAIVRERAGKEIRRVERLARIVERALRGRRRERIHPATRTFQALRIAVNGELEALRLALPRLAVRLRSGGRICVISFHSLEDRIVKRAFRDLSSTCTCPPGSPVCTCGAKPILRLLVRKPLRPAEEEILSNPRARSARLRAAERLEREREVA